MADFRRWFMKKDPTMNRLSASRFCVVSGKYLTVAGLVLLAIRSFAIEIFSFPPENNYIAPAGRVMEPEEETFSFAAASDTGAKNAPIERIVKQAQEGGNRFLLYLGDLVRYRNISHFRWIVSELDEKLDLPFYMIPGNHEIADRSAVTTNISTGWFSVLFITGFLTATSCLSVWILRKKGMMTHSLNGWRTFWKKCVRISGIASSIPTCRRLPTLRGASRF